MIDEPTEDTGRTNGDVPVGGFPDGRLMRSAGDEAGRLSL
jgi:hypothetical protein